MFQPGFERHPGWIKNRCRRAAALGQGDFGGAASRHSAPLCSTHCRWAILLPNTFGFPSFSLALICFPIACSLAGLGKCFSWSPTRGDGVGDIFWWRKIPCPYCRLLVQEQCEYVSLNQLGKEDEMLAPMVSRAGLWLRGSLRGPRKQGWVPCNTALL